MGASLLSSAEADACDTTHVRCDRCGDGLLREQSIQTAFWRSGGLVVIRNIPAMVCGACGEEYVADRTALALDRMRGARPGALGAVERMIVPVLEYVDVGTGE